MQYAILSASNAQDLQSLVNERLPKGWQLYGNPFTEKGAYYQAMVYNRS
jgi:hypothetical protein